MTRLNARIDSRMIDKVDHLFILLQDRPGAAIAGARILAYIGASDEQALAVASDITSQIQGSETEMHHEINGVAVQIVAAEPLSEIEDVTEITFDGYVVIKLITERGNLVSLDTEWELLDSFIDTHALKAA